MHHVFTPLVYWALVAEKDRGKFRSIDEAVRNLLGLPPGCKNPRKKVYNEEYYDSSRNKTRDDYRPSWMRSPQQQRTRNGK